nr:hypothetical protein [Tepidiforma sp.]
MAIHARWRSPPESAARGRSARARASVASRAHSTASISWRVTRWRKPWWGVAAAEGEFADGEVEAGGRGLGEDGEDAGDVAGVHRADVAAVEEDAAAARGVETGHAAEKGALAAPVRAEDGDHLAGDDVEGDVADDIAAAVGEGQAFDGEIHRKRTR